MRDRVVWAWVRVAIVWVFCLPAGGLADELIFDNGDRLTGSLVGMTKGEIAFESDVVGRVSVRVRRVESLSTEEPIAVVLDDGTIVRERVVGGQEGVLAFADPNLPSPRLDEVEEINPKPERWHGRISAGVIIERGDTDKQEARVEMSLRRETKRWRSRTRLLYEGERSRSTGEDYSTKDRLYRGRTQFDWNLTERAFWYTRLRAERDGVADLDLRTITGSGLGYRLIDRAAVTFEVQAGGAWVRERYGDNRLDTDYPAAVAIYDLDVNLFDPVHLFSDGEWVPSLREFNDLQLFTTETGFRVGLTRDWFAEVKLIWELDTEPSEDKERQNVNYVFALGWEF
jgi:putative salt-induced outer membrane protein YdiY